MACSLKSHVSKLTKKFSICCLISSLQFAQSKPTGRLTQQFGIKNTDLILFALISLIQRFCYTLFSLRPHERTVPKTLATHGYKTLSIGDI